MKFSFWKWLKCAFTKHGGITNGIKPGTWICKQCGGVAWREHR